MKSKSENIKNLLIIFVKNSKIGEVKTRLAKSIGYKNAFSVYQYLVNRIQLVTNDIQVEKLVLYSDTVVEDDGFSSKVFQKGIQKGKDIGQKMNNAFDSAFHSGYKNVVLIGSDIINLTDDVIINAFESLNSCNVVLGPARDGGYYLIGMSQHYPTIFSDISWSTKQVFKETIENCKAEGIKPHLIKTLSDFDVIEDVSYLTDKDIESLEKELLGFADKGIKKLAV